MKNSSIFLKVDLKDWVLGTIAKVQQGTEWNAVWSERYREIGGESDTSGEKGCPMKAAETLYLLGRIKGGDKEWEDPPLRTVWDEYSKNGVYALIALNELEKNSDIPLPELWEKIKTRVRVELCEEPAENEQGEVKVVVKLWHLGLII